MQFNTPLRYPGGKGKLTDYIKLIIVQNDLISGQYFEGYAGGFGIALNLLFDEYVSNVHLNDLNTSVYSFWYSALHYPDELCKKIQDTKITIDEWHRQKEIQKDADNNSIFDLGFSTFFLNRTNRSGIIKGGVIGGKQQDGEWKLDARFNKSNLIQRIEKIALNRSRIHLYNMDAADVIKDILPTLPINTLVYLDPPYYVKGKGLYESHYGHEDHVSIANLVRNQIHHPWIVSYDHTPEIIEIYKGTKSISYGINYTAQNRYHGAEIMFFSESIKVPDIKNPANLKIA